MALAAVKPGLRWTRQFRRAARLHEVVRQKEAVFGEDGGKAQIGTGGSRGTIPVARKRHLMAPAHRLYRVPTAPGFANELWCFCYHPAD
jgi:hypothetical protein